MARTGGSLKSSNFLLEKFLRSTDNLKKVHPKSITQIRDLFSRTVQ